MDSGPLVPTNAPIIREMLPIAGDLGKNSGPRVYPELLSPGVPRSANMFAFWSSGNGPCWPASRRYFPWLRSPA